MDTECWTRESASPGWLSDVGRSCESHRGNPEEQVRGHSVQDELQSGGKYDVLFKKIKIKNKKKNNPYNHFKNPMYDET